MTHHEYKLARAIEHTLLKPEATVAQIDALCEEAVAHGFHAVCVNPRFVAGAVKRLESLTAGGAIGHGPVVVSVAGFPLGASSTAIKADEARRAMDDGAREIDMVAPLGALIGGDAREVQADIAAVARAVHQTSPPGLLKVILETAALSEEQIILGCRLCAEGEADFVKTSTGLHPSGGATAEAVRLLRRTASPIRVKAAGGIRDAATALTMLQAGAVRLGTSSSVVIVEQWRSMGQEL